MAQSGMIAPERRSELSILSRFVPAAAVALLLLTSCAQVSVTGPCEVQSDSSITLDIAWSLEEGFSGAASPTVSSTAVTSVVTKLNGVTSSRPFRIRTDAAGDTVTLMLEVPSTWSETDVSATVDGAPATLVGLDDAPYCADMIGTSRAGYVRRFYQVTPAAPLTPESNGTLQVTYATATIADGVYHPAVMVLVEPDVEAPCFPQTSFHRVTAGTLKFVNFDLASSFNADTVVNGTDVEQDSLMMIQDGETTVRLAFATESFLGTLLGVPDDALLTPDRYALQVADMGLLELPECLPAIQLGWSETSDGNNSWLQQTEDDALVVDVPDAHYAELLLYVMPSVGDIGGEILGPEDLFRAMRVQMTYEDGPVTEVATLVPVLGLPIAFPALAPDAPDLVPSFTMGLGILTDSDGSAESGATTPAGIAAMLVTPDSSRRLVSVTITPFIPDMSEAPIVTAKSPQSQAALEPVKLAVFGAAGMQLVPNLALDKSLVTPAPYVIGNEVTYQVAVTNSGNAPAPAVTVTDTIEPQLAFVSATASAGTCGEAGGVVTCSLGEIGPGASATIDIVANIVAVGPFSNTAAASMDGEEDDTSDNEDTVAAVALGIPNLAVGKTVETPGPYLLGSEITYRLAVTNDGTADSTAVTVTDALPAGLVFVSAVPSAGTCGEAAGTVTCSIGPLATGASATVDIVATIDSIGSITNTGTASMDGGEADVSDNAASVTIAADGIANLAFGKTVETPAPHIVGTQVTYRLTVSNDGTADSTAVTVADALPLGLGYVSATPTAGTCSESGGTVTCSLGVIAAGASETVDIVATIMGEGEITNTASASMTGGEADVSDNSASVTIAAAPASIAGVPTLSEWAMLLMVSMLGLIAVARMRA